ncbi:hypothetical protein JCM33374_g970 [Metschnikowia sp. JCM 33374]|nr:hypothetical protein JCM33374_g970 [Metschnikowia sp. JCM 33374]
MSEEPIAKRPKLEPEDESANVVRSIDACQRCRAKKVKCDQNFPTCLRCKKAGVECVGVDRATGRTVPRSYVYNLEQENLSLRSMLTAHGIDPNHVSRDSQGSKASQVSQLSKASHVPKESSPAPLSQPVATEKEPQVPVALPKLDTLPDQISTGSPMYMGASSGITFAKLITAAVRLNEQTSHLQVDPSKNPSVSENKPVVLPPKDTAQQFIRIYFTHSNSQLPILHREIFLSELFEPVYGHWDESLSPFPAAQPFSKNTLHANIAPEDTWFFKYKAIISQKLSSEKSLDNFVLNPSDIPEIYHRSLFYLNVIFAIASSVNHLQYANDISEQFRKEGLKFVNSTYSATDPLQQLEAKLLLALFSIMRPCNPGIWYVLGQCLRICVDLGLHNNATDKSGNLDAFTKDRRRRLFWCTYSLDRQICFYMGRPVGIPETSIKTTFPSELDDAHILKDSPGVKDYSEMSGGIPSYKIISLSFFRIRRLQSEVQRILYEDEELPRRFATLDQWKADIQARLDDWWAHARETQYVSGQYFHIEFFCLNYNHAVLSLNGLSPKSFKLTQDALMKVAEASKNLISCYKQLHIKKAINYTWAAVHNLFMAGTSFLYGLYHSGYVRQMFPKEMVMKTTEDCITVLSSLTASCDAANHCSQMFRMLTAAILKLRYNESVDGSTLVNTDQDSPSDYNSHHWTMNPSDAYTMKQEESHNAVAPRFDGFHPSSSTHHPDNNTHHTTMSPHPGTGTNTHHIASSPHHEINPHHKYTEGGFNQRFTWVRRKDSESEEVEVEPPKRGSSCFQESNLEEFFMTVAQASPGTSIGDVAENSYSDYSLEMGNNASQWVAPPKDGQKVFELIQPLPTELIWGQYFGTETRLPE